MQSQIRKIISIVLVLPFLLLSVIPASYAQGVMQLPEPGSMIGLTSAFVPAHLIGVSVDTQNPFQFEFLIHKGEEPLSDIEKRNEYQILIKYFLAALTVPNIDQWVNLSPYEQTRMIQDNFGQTDMGRDLLAQDYLLKQLTASLMHPDSDLGRNFWKRIYEKAYQEHGTADIEVDAFNKVWILPDTAEVFEQDNTALISNSYLRVMTENDYLAMENNALTRSIGEEAEISQSAPISSSIVKEIIIPELEREVNQGKTFANLRQIYGAMILATWFKQQLRETILGKAYADHSTVNGIDQDPKNNEVVYQQYLQAFQVGVVNMIKEEVDQSTQEIVPRKYFSGGAWGVSKVGVTKDLAQKPQIPSDFAEAVGVVVSDFAQNLPHLFDRMAFLLSDPVVIDKSDMTKQDLFHILASRISEQDRTWFFNFNMVLLALEKVAIRTEDTETIQYAFDKSAVEDILIADSFKPIVVARMSSLLAKDITINKSDRIKQDLFHILASRISESADANLFLNINKMAFALESMFIREDSPDSIQYTIDKRRINELKDILRANVNHEEIEKSAKIDDIAKQFTYGPLRSLIYQYGRQAVLMHARYVRANQESIDREAALGRDVTWLNTLKKEKEETQARMASQFAGELSKLIEQDSLAPLLSDKKTDALIKNILGLTFNNQPIQDPETYVWFLPNEDIFQYEDDVVRTISEVVTDAAALTPEDAEKRAKRLIASKFVPQIASFLREVTYTDGSKDALISQIEEVLDTSHYSLFFHDLKTVSSELAEYFTWTKNGWALRYYTPLPNAVTQAQKEENQKRLHANRALHQILIRGISVKRVIQKVNSGLLHPDIFYRDIAYVIHFYFKDQKSWPVVTTTEFQMQAHLREYIRNRWFGPSLPTIVIGEIADQILLTLKSVRQADGTLRYWPPDLESKPSQDADRMSYPFISPKYWSVQALPQIFEKNQSAFDKTQQMNEISALTVPHIMMKTLKPAVLSTQLPEELPKPIANLIVEDAKKYEAFIKNTKYAYLLTDEDITAVAFALAVQKTAVRLNDGSIEMSVDVIAQKQALYKIGQAILQPQQGYFFRDLVSDVMVSAIKELSIAGLQGSLFLGVLKNDTDEEISALKKTSKYSTAIQERQEKVENYIRSFVEQLWFVDDIIPQVKEDLIRTLINSIVFDERVTKVDPEIVSELEGDFYLTSFAYFDMTEQAPWQILLQEMIGAFFLPRALLEARGEEIYQFFAQSILEGLSATVNHTTVLTPEELVGLDVEAFIKNYRVLVNPLNDTSVDSMSIIQKALAQSPFARFFNDLNSLAEELAQAGVTVRWDGIPVWSESNKKEVLRVLQKWINPSSILREIRNGRMDQDVLYDAMFVDLTQLVSNYHIMFFNRKAADVEIQIRAHIAHQWFAPFLSLAQQEKLIVFLVDLLANTPVKSNFHGYSVAAIPISAEFWKQTFDKILSSADELDEVSDASSKTEKPVNTGGIDFNEQYLQMNIKHDGNGVVLPINQQDFANIKIDGLTPYILTIQPVAASPVFHQLTQ